MKMYVKPSIEVIELQLKEDIAAVPTTVYKGRSSAGTGYDEYKIGKAATGISLNADVLENYGISISA